MGCNGYITCVVLKVHNSVCVGHIFNAACIPGMHVFVTLKGHWAICCFSQWDKGWIQSRGAQVVDQTDQGRLGLASLD